MRTFLPSPARKNFGERVHSGQLTGQDRDPGWPPAPSVGRPGGSLVDRERDRPRRIGRAAAGRATSSPRRWYDAGTDDLCLDDGPGLERRRAGREEHDLSLAGPALVERRRHGGPRPRRRSPRVRPTRPRWRSSAERSTTAFRRAKRSAMTSGGTSSSTSSAAAVPGRGEKMKVNVESNCASAATSSVASNSASVSPGKPTMRSVVTARSGMLCAGRLEALEVALGGVAALHRDAGPCCSRTAAAGAAARRPPRSRPSRRSSRREGPSDAGW